MRFSEFETLKEMDSVLSKGKFMTALAKRFN